MDSVFFEAPPDELYELVGQYGDEQVAINAFFFVVVDGAQAQL